MNRRVMVYRILQIVKRVIASIASNRPRVRILITLPQRKGLRLTTRRWEFELINMDLLSFRAISVTIFKKKSAFLSK